MVVLYCATSPRAHCHSCRLPSPLTRFCLPAHSTRVLTNLSRQFSQGAFLRATKKISHVAFRKSNEHDSFSSGNFPQAKLHFKQKWFCLKPRKVVCPLDWTGLGEKQDLSPLHTKENSCWSCHDKDAEGNAQKPWPPHLLQGAGFLA